MTEKKATADKAQEVTPVAAATTQTDAEKEAQRIHDERMANAEAEAARRDEINRRAEMARFRPIKPGEWR